MGPYIAVLLQGGLFCVKSAMFVVMVFFTSKKLIIIFRILHLSEIHLLPLKALQFHHSGKQLNIIIHVYL